MVVSNRLFKNPVTLDIYLYLLNQEGSVRIRNAQRELSIASTLHWHLNKLLEAGLVEKLPDNIYLLTSAGRELKRLEVPVTETYYLFSGRLYSQALFQLAFLLSSLLIGILLVLIIPNTANIFLLMVVATETFLIWRRFYPWSRKPMK